MSLWVIIALNALWLVFAIVGLGVCLMYAAGVFTKRGGKK